MSKRPNKKQSGKLPKAARGKLTIPGVPIVILALAILTALGFLWRNSKATNSAAAPIAQANAANPAAAAGDFELQKLKGAWRRPDGGYVLAIKSVVENGAMEAAYFNPNPIHVAKAEASRDGAATTVFIELRDVNYPGSTYNLIYDPASDQLKGIYYQAVEQQRFEVVFVRIK